MRLKNQLLTLSLLTLLLPWSVWKLVQELENFLREAEENALTASALTVSQLLPLESRAELKLASGQILPLQKLMAEPVVDGYFTDWSQTDQTIGFESTTGLLQMELLAGRFQSHLFLAVKVIDPGEINATTFNTGTSDPGQRAGVVLYLQSKRGQFSYMVSTEAPGPLTIESTGDKGTRLDAAWIDNGNGYQLELSLPSDVQRVGIGAVAPAHTMRGLSVERYAGTLDGRKQGQWLQLLNLDDDTGEWLSRIASANSRAWLLQSEGWVLGDSGPMQADGNTELTWVQRLVYQAVADSDMPVRGTRAAWPVRLKTDLLDPVLQGGTSKIWDKDADSAAVYNLVAVPVYSNENETDGVAGVLVLEARSEGLLLITNRVLGRFLLIALILMVILTAGLWLFASRLSGRVQKLSAEVSRAMDGRGQVQDLPLTASEDELGDLARNTEKLLKAVTEYKAYLQKLAGRLSHELKTPIAITRSSIENLASQDLDTASQQYLERAREGLDRQSAIVAAMSEAQRLEGSVLTADWKTIDLGEMLENSLEAYRSVHPQRVLRLNLPAQKCELRCAPDLIVQALDKLVDNAISLTMDDCDIGVSLSNDDGCYLVSVSNSGTRLPDVLDDQLFDSLVSLRQNRGSRHHLGLGLHIVRLVAEAHAGSVSACNLPRDEGVEFTIRLPAG